MNNISLTDETLNKNQTHYYILSIRHSSGGFSFCIYDTITNKYLGLYNYCEAETIKDITEKNEMLKSDFKSVKIQLYQNQSTIIPVPLFYAEKLEEFVNMNFVFDPNSETILYNKINSINSYIVFSVKNEILKQYNNLFKNVGFYHQGFSFVESIMISNKNKPVPDSVYAMINNNLLDICVYKDKGIELYNSFCFSNNQELLYYLLNVYEVFNLNPEKTPLFIQGFINKNDAVVFEIKKYLKNVSFDKPLESIAHSYKFTEVHLHPFNNLLNLNLCE